MDKKNDKETKEDLLLIFKVLYDNKKISQSEYHNAVNIVYKRYA